MTLRTRLSVFLLTLLGVVLIGFSAAFFFIAKNYIQRQATERLDSAMNTLVAAVEISPDGVEWEPDQRALAFSPAAFGGVLSWVLMDERGRLVDHSAPGADTEFLFNAAKRLTDDDRSAAVEEWQGEVWHVSQRWVRPAGETRPSGNSQESGEGPSPTKHGALGVTAAISLSPSRSVVWLSAEVLAVLSVAIWLAALVATKAVCRRALLPVTHMASAARAMSADDLSQRLPPPATRDELQDLSGAFNNLLDRLQESFERQERFTADASHQLRTPLAAILGQIEVALRRQRSPEEYVRVLTTLKSKTLYLQQIAEALLFLARADAEARLPELKTAYLSDWLTQHLTGWAEHARSGDIITDFPADDAVSVRTHPVLLGELLNILLENACKYSEPGTPIRVALRTDRQWATLAVQDQGCGINERDIDRLWEPFFRSSESRRRGVAGLGLGLSIARRLAQALGGELSVTSKLDHGSTFTLKIVRTTVEELCPVPANAEKSMNEVIAEATVSMKS